MDIRLFDPVGDREALFRIWAETSELDRSNPEKCAALEAFYGAGRVHVAELHGEVECTVFDAMGTLRYGDVDLPFSGVMSVDVGLPARRQGLASRVTAYSVARDRDDGALVTGLGMFDQGFYNNLGFGTGPYQNLLTFNPADLRVPMKARPPHRLDSRAVLAMHGNRVNRHRGHGAVTFPHPAISGFNVAARPNGMGLGYFDGPDGALSHHLFFWSDAAEHGPYTVDWMAWQTGKQLQELLALLRSLSDQIRCVRMLEPPGMQLQDLLYRPFAAAQITRGGRMESSIRAMAYWQMRINDVVGCLVKTSLPWCSGLRFNAEISDPIEPYLEGEEWRGESGTYVVELGVHCFAEKGRDETLPTLQASIGAFTRMWLGALPATGLAVGDALMGPTDLLDALDEAFRLPRPTPGWNY